MCSGRRLCIAPCGIRIKGQPRRRVPLYFYAIHGFRLTKARQNFDESPKRTFTYEEFSYNVVKIFFGQLHQLTTNEVSLVDGLELMVFCNCRGQIDMGSDFETRLFQDLHYQLMRMIKDSKQLCFIWMYFRLWGPSGWV